MTTVYKLGNGISITVFEHEGRHSALMAAGEDYGSAVEAIKATISKEMEALSKAIVESAKRCDVATMKSLVGRLCAWGEVYKHKKWSQQLDLKQEFKEISELSAEDREDIYQYAVKISASIVECAVESDRDKND